MGYSSRLYFIFTLSLQLLIQTRENKDKSLKTSCFTRVFIPILCPLGVLPTLPQSLIVNGLTFAEVAHLLRVEIQLLVQLLGGLVILLDLQEHLTGCLAVCP